MTTRPRVQFDPNVRVLGNGTYTSRTDADEPVTSGTEVVLFEPEAEIEVDGRVTAIDEERGLIYFTVAWESARESQAQDPHNDPQAEAQHRPSTTSNDSQVGRQGLEP